MPRSSRILASSRNRLHAQSVSSKPAAGASATLKMVGLTMGSGDSDGDDVEARALGRIAAN
jgi:hypothetical protein